MVVTAFKNVGERSTAKTYRPVSRLSVVSKVFEKLINNKIVDHQKKWSQFSDFQYGFVVSDRIAGAFNRSGATWTVALDISKAFHKVWPAGLFHKLNSNGIYVRYLVLFLFFLVVGDFGLFWMGSLYNNIQLMLEFLEDPFLVLHFSCYTLLIFLMLSVILLSMLMILLSTLSVIRHLVCGNK